QARPQHTQPRLVPLVQRIADGRTPFGRTPGGRQTVLGGMPSRALLSSVLGLLAALASPVFAADVSILVQRSPLAGIRHYDAADVWRDMNAGDRLEIVREPENAHDANAVRVEWRGRKLGYLPRTDNAAVARQLDRGAVLEARIAALRQNRNHTLRLEL